ncbi:hypothetical protein BKA80DRAFT_312645 [Phyllosticta citrichinensis]
MATPTEHQRPIHLTNGPLPIALSLDRFLVTWRDADTHQDLALGNLAAGASPAIVDAADSGARKPELLFRLAWDAASGGVLLYFYLPLKMRAAARGRRDIYLVVPAEGIEGMDVNEEHPRAASHDGDGGDDEKSGGGRENAKVLRLRISLSRPSSVIMPTAGAKRPLSTQSRGLLLSLKSLAQARGFEVALPHSAKLEDVLRDVANRVDGAGDQLHTPEIDHEKTFSGRAWAVGPWEQYLLREGERLEVAWNPVLDEAPPAYEDVVRVVADDARGGLEVGEAAGEEDDDDDGGGRHGAFKDVMLGLNGEEQGKGGQQGGLPLETYKVCDHGTQQTTRSIHPAPQCRKAAPAAAAQGNAQQTTGSIPTLKRKAASSPPPTAPVPTPQTKGSIRPAVPITTSALLHTLHTYLSPSSPPGALASQLPLPPHSQSVLHLGRSRALFSDAQYARFFNGVAWLATLWPRRPAAHLALLPHCGRMMQCVRRDDAARFVQQRVEAMAAALTLSGAQEEDKGTQRRDEKRQRRSARLGTRNPLDGPPTQAGARLAEFVYVCIGEGVDNFIVDDLLALQEHSNGKPSHTPDFERPVHHPSPPAMVAGSQYGGVAPTEKTLQPTPINPKTPTIS